MTYGVEWLTGGGILGSSDMASEFVNMHAWSVIRSCCSFTLSPPPKDHLKGIVQALAVLSFDLVSMNMLERYTDLPIFYCLSTNFLCLVDLCLSHHGIFFLFIKWSHGAFVYWNSLY